MKDLQNLVHTDGIDLVTFGQRLRHLRRMRGLTLTELGERVDRAPSVLSLIENGRREPKLSLIEQLATALSVPMTELLSRQPPSRRAQLEIALADAQQDPSYRRLGLPQLKDNRDVRIDRLFVDPYLSPRYLSPESNPDEWKDTVPLLDAVTAEEREELERREHEYRIGRPLPDVRGKTVILVDDGLATGASMRAAIAALRERGVARIVVAVPVGAPETCAKVAAEADELICVVQFEDFRAVGEVYDDFSQTTDSEVCDLLNLGAGKTQPRIHTDRHG